MSGNISVYQSLDELASYLRLQLENKKCALLYANNGTGKTRLSMTFKDIGKQGEAELKKLENKIKSCKGTP